MTQTMDRTTRLDQPVRATVSLSAVVLGAVVLITAIAPLATDMYVPRALSEPTAAAIGGLRPWVTSEWEHDGLRVSGGTVLDRLIAMNHGEA